MIGTVKKRGNLRREIYRARMWYLFTLPIILYFCIFKIYPLWYTQIAFKDYRVTSTIAASSWVGLEHFRTLAKTPGFWNALRNTLIISFYKLTICFPIPILYAVILNELRRERVKKLFENILYLPHFISWVMIGSLLVSLTQLNGGLFNSILETAGQDKIMFLGRADFFRGIVVVTDVWKESGWSMIIYMAALTSIDPQLYEAARIDGASKGRLIWHISLAGIREIIVVLLIMRVGNVLNVGFEQVQTLLNDMTMSTGDILDTFVFRVGIQNGRYALASAAGVFKSLVAAVLLFSADRVAKSMGETGLF